MDDPTDDLEFMYQSGVALRKQEAAKVESPVGVLRQNLFHAAISNDPNESDAAEVIGVWHRGDGALANADESLIKHFFDVHGESPEWTASQDIQSLAALLPKSVGSGAPPACDYFFSELVAMSGIGDETIRKKAAEVLPAKKRVKASKYTATEAAKVFEELAKSSTVATRDGAKAALKSMGMPQGISNDSPIIQT